MSAHSAGKTFFISDTHLDPARPETTAMFLEIMSERVSGAKALYLLGDIFEFWIGDDAVSDTASEVARATASLAASGTKIYFMPGNRDFLIGAAYAAKAGWEMLAEPAEVEVNGVKLLLLHGDSLCTDDHAYQAFRQQVRNPAWQQDFLSRSIVERLNMAEQARAQSKDYTADADNAIMDVNNQAVLEEFAKSSAKVMIHGHTHRPNTHSLAIDGEPYKRVVLGDWYQDAWLIEADENGLELICIKAWLQTNASSSS